jgi:hypothetical protein
VYDRFNLVMYTRTAVTFSISTPGIRITLPSGVQLLRNVNYAQARRYRELARLYDLILHPELAWVNRLGEPVVAIKSAQRKKQLP